MKQTLITDYIEFRMENGIVVASYKSGIHINLEIARQIVEARLQFTENKTLPVLINSQGVVEMDKAARDFLSSDQGTRGLKAAAILVTSPFSSFLGNFFLMVNRAGIPVKIFTKSEPALQWLKQFVSES